MRPTPIVIAALALLGVLNFYTETASMSGAGADVYKIGDQQWRFQQISAAVPPHGAIGYVTDQRGSQAQAMLLGAQYVLAPRALMELSRHPDSPWVIGNFSRQIDYAEFGQKRGLVEIEDFGAGVVLFRKAAQ